MRLVRIASFDQAELRQMVRLFKAGPAFEQPGAGNRRDLVAKQAHGVRRHMVGRGMAQRQVEVGNVQVHGAV